MNELDLYHGSKIAVRQPLFDLCRPNNDYGRGFYCTQNIDLAKEWACQEGHDGFASKYTIDIDDLHLLDLNASRFNILNWLAVLLENRILKATSPTMARGMRWLQENYYVDISHADIVKGYRADDSYFSFARAFVRNEITLSQLSEAMHLGKLGEQYMIKSEKAFGRLKYVGSEPVDSSVYWPLRKKRDSEARANFSKIIMTDFANAPTSKNEVFISILMSMRKDDLDVCLRQNLPS